jgi:hypothetical protein
MLDERLHHRERAGLETRAQILDRARQRRRPGEAARGQEAADVELGAWRRLDAPE